MACKLAYVAKFPTRLITPKMIPPVERMVRYEPPALSGTGAVCTSLANRSCITLGDPILFDVPYTVNVNSIMMMNKTVVCVLRNRHKRTLGEILRVMIDSKTH